MSRHFFHSRSFRIAAAAALSTSWPAGAQLVAYDGFANGPLPDLAGSTGGSGWTSAWNGSASTLVTSIAGPGLTFPGLATSPGAAVTEPQVFYPDAASYTRSIQPITGGHFYMSFLLRPGAQYTTLGAGIRWGAYPGWILCGAPDGSAYGFHVGRYIYVYSNAPVVSGQTVLIVMDMEVIPGTPAQTVYRMYINHPVGQPQPGFADAEYATGGAVAMPSAIEIANDGDYTTDEIRIGTTWASVLPSPCYANCDASTTAPILNVLDFSCFLNRFAAGDTYANCDNSTTPPALNVLDLSCFLNRFATGCN